MLCLWLPCFVQWPYMNLIAKLCLFFLQQCNCRSLGFFHENWKLQINRITERISSKIALKTNVYVLASFSCKSIRDRRYCCWAATFPFLFISAFGVQIISASIWICWFIGRHSIGRIEMQQHTNHSTNVKCHFTFWCQTHMTLHILCMFLLCVQTLQININDKDRWRKKQLSFSPLKIEESIFSDIMLANGYQWCRRWKRLHFSSIF